MKKAVRYSLYSAVTAALCVAFCILCHFSRQERNTDLCKSIEIAFADSLHFLDTEDVAVCIDDNYGTPVGKKYGEVDLKKIEDILEMKPDIARSEAWMTTDGVLHVLVFHRRPVCIFRDGQNCFYADASGFIFPVHDDPVTGVPVIDGPASTNVEHLTEIMDIVNNLPDGICRMQIDSRCNISFFREDGPEKFLFGQPEGKEEKFDKYGKYIGRILPSAEGKGYTSVDLRYANQIICK